MSSRPPSSRPPSSRPASPVRCAPQLLAAALLLGGCAVAPSPARPAATPRTAPTAAALAAPSAAADAPPADTIVFTRLTNLNRDCTSTTSAGTVCRVREQLSAATLRARWQQAGAAVWVEGDRLTFAYEGEAEQVEACCTIQMPLSRLPNSDLWVLTVRVPRPRELAMGYDFIVTRKDAPPATRLKMKEWRGPDAPRALPRAETLAGTVRHDTLQSAALGEPRALTTYLPPGYDRTRALPVVYVADGQSVPGIAKVLEPQILAGRAPAVVLVGVHSGKSSRGADIMQDHRALEYLYGADRENRRFVAHERFVLTEVLPWAERELGVAAARERRAVLGFSNGAGWTVAVTARNPEAFGNVLAFSFAWDSAGGIPAGGLPVKPRYFLLAGLLEHNFHARTASLARVLRGHGLDVRFEERVSGHDSLMWDELVPEAVAWAFRR